MKVLYDEKYKVIDYIKTEIPAVEVTNNLDRLNALMVKLTNEFYDLELYNANKLIEYAKEKNIYLGNDYLLFKHSSGTAMLRAYSFGLKKENGYKTEINPAITISTGKFSTGWTFDTGLFADVYTVFERYEYFSISTRDTVPIHNLYLHWVMEKLEEQFLDKSIHAGVDDTFYRDYKRLFDKLKPICIELDDYITRNKSLRIDGLIENEISVKDYIKTNIRYKHVHSEIDVFKCCMIYGKPYDQVKKYINKILS